MIFVLDFGSQYSHLITRRIRELGVFAELINPDTPLEEIKNADGIILSGGPQNLSSSNALRVDKKIFDLGIPILGICYGLQLTAYELGGTVKAGKKREYGPAEISIHKSPLFQGLAKKQMTWMSHGDKVTKLPKNFRKIASSKNCTYTAIENSAKKIYGLQFHPEVIHTKNGKQILANFLKITKAKKNWSMQSFIGDEIKKIKIQIGKKDHAVCALSGGIDSAVAAMMARQAIDRRLHCIFVDTGLMRTGEVDEIKTTFKSYAKLDLKIINAENIFLKKLNNITNPEKKRTIIGKLFIEIFEREAKKITRQPKYLVQGTLYPDWIESALASHHSVVIKTHHNVGGLPKKFGFDLIEPLKFLYKDEVRKLGTLLKLPKNITSRQPFPGPGLAVRIIGTITKEKLNILRQADLILRQEIENSPERKKIQQYLAVLPNIKSVGVQGDSRTYGHPIIIRAVSTPDLMTAEWTKLSHKLLDKISSRITNEIPEINRVVYDITNKPPGTVEWE